MHSVDTYLEITPQCSHEALRPSHFLHQDPATHDAMWIKNLEALIELLMINSLETPPALIPVLMLRIVLILGYLEIEANELAKSSVNAVYAQDDSHK
jgi:hypothetical protein